MLRRIAQDEIWRNHEIKAVLVRSGGRAAMIAGDARHSVVQRWKPDRRFEYDVDAAMDVALRMRFLEQASQT